MCIQLHNFLYHTAGRQGLLIQVAFPKTICPSCIPVSLAALQKQVNSHAQTPCQNSRVKICSSSYRARRSWGYQGLKKRVNRRKLKSSTMCAPVSVSCRRLSRFCTAVRLSSILRLRLANCVLGPHPCGPCDVSSGWRRRRSDVHILRRRMQMLEEISQGCMKKAHGSAYASRLCGCTYVFAGSLVV